MFQRKVNALSGGLSDSTSDSSVLTAAGLGGILAGASILVGGGPAPLLASLLIPVVELLNTSVEKTVDATGIYNDTTRKAKDAGALAVAVSTGIAVLMVLVAVIAWVRGGGRPATAR